MTEALEETFTTIGRTFSNSTESKTVKYTVSVEQGLQEIENTPITCLESNLFSNFIQQEGSIKKTMTKGSPKLIAIVSNISVFISNPKVSFFSG